MDGLVALDEVAIFDTAKDADWVANVYNTAQNKLDLSRVKVVL